MVEGEVVACLVMVELVPCDQLREVGMTYTREILMDGNKMKFSQL